jgi:hypothetical protein
MRQRQSSEPPGVHRGESRLSETGVCWSRRGRYAIVGQMRWRGFGCFLCALVGACAGGTRRAEAPVAGGAGIWWAETLRLTSREAIPDELRRPFQDPIDVVGRPGVEPATAQMRNCADYLRLRERGYAPVRDDAWGAMREAGARCQALRLLEQSRPARVGASNLPDSPRLLDWLPPTVGPQTSPDRRQARLDAAGAGQSWRGFEPLLPVTSRSRTSAVVRGRDYQTALELLATADVDGDGAADEIVKVTSSGSEGNWVDQRVVVLGAGTVAHAQEIPL